MSMPATGTKERIVAPMRGWAPVALHVDEFGGRGHRLEGGLDHSLGRAHHGHYGTVGRRTRIDIEQGYAVHAADGSDVFDDGFVHVLLRSLVRTRQWADS